MNNISKRSRNASGLETLIEHMNEVSDFLSLSNHIQIKSFLLIFWNVMFRNCPEAVVIIQWSSFFLIFWNVSNLPRNGGQFQLNSFLLIFWHVYIIDLFPWTTVLCTQINIASNWYRSKSNFNINLKWVKIKLKFVKIKFKLTNIKLKKDAINFKYAKFNSK